MWLFRLPPKLSFSTPFLNGTTLLSKPTTTTTLSSPSPPSFLPPIKAMKSLQGKVVCSTNDKTVAVEVVRLAPHPKYKRRVRKKKKYQAHDPNNQFKVGDVVLLQKSRPISKTKTFIAIAAPTRDSNKKLAVLQEDADDDEEKGELSIPLESQQQQP